MREKKMIALLKTLTILFRSFSSYIICDLYGDRGHLIVLFCEEDIHLIYVLS